MWRRCAVIRADSLAGMSIRWRRIADEVVRFLAVGGLATLVAVLLFNFLVHGFRFGNQALLASEPVLAYVIANFIGMMISYRGTRTWAFKHREPVHADGGRTMYLVINVATMTLPVACLWFSRSVLGLDDPVSDNISANVIGLLLGVVARFVLFRQLVFARPNYRATPLVGTTTLPFEDRPAQDGPGDAVTEATTATPTTDPAPRAGL